ncbi:sensor histidine kinase [Blastococcus sp. CT_GayMR16]|uniref:sensor histidine kinase n=1 Tax=Blastococcus sp. CT_GayMR16 TaxID=2559607 RepID=UPI001073C5EF|nr:sensor histidine kinase [Blastococcus sp. CT_GayMR16]TFV87413.1 sensor histidine kinase [Blastococcus sp. CT_GayMR16]
MSGRRLVAGLTGIGTALLLTAIVGSVTSGLGWADVVDSYTLTNCVIGAGFLGSGALIAWSRPDNRLGWLFLVCGLGHLTTAASAPVIAIGLDAGWPDAVVRALSTLFIAAWQLGIVGLFPLALLLFPDGRLSSPRWRPVAWLIVALMVVQIGIGVLSAEPATADPATVSILSTDLVLSDAAWAVVNVSNVLVLVLVVVSLVLRYRRGPEQVRRQVLWLILAVLVLGVLNSQRWLTGDGPILLLLSFVLVPIAIAIAVLRHQLLDIRLVVSRAVLYLIVSIALVAVYAGLVAGLSQLVPDDADRGIAALAALAVAFAFAPVRSVVQRVVDRAFYGSRADALTAAEDVARGVAPGADLDEVLEQARETLRLPALTLVRNGVAVAAAGSLPDGARRAEVALAEGTPSAALLEVGLRRGEDALHAADRRVLTLIGTPLALALYSADLAGQVQESRAALVGAHAEERLRLHRELHDGLGPVLTGAAFRADAASNVLHRDPQTADRLLGEVRAGVRQAIDDVRRVVYGLRPLELEERGLVGALRQRLGSATSVQVVLEAPEEIEGLPPAVEVAAFRIVSEAVTNVLRHSSATRGVVRLWCSPSSLCLEVTDDGSGASDWVPGVGLRSLLVRAEELGGRAVAGPTPGGGRVSAELPL